MIRYEIIVEGWCLEGNFYTYYVSRETILLDRVIQIGADRYDASGIYRLMTGIVMIFNLLHINRF